MKAISLLPPEIKHYRKRRSLILMSGLIVVILILASTSYYFFLMFSVRNIEEQIEEVADKREEVKLRIDELVSYEELYEHAAYVEETMGMALEDTPDWRLILVELGESAPTNTWFTDVSMNYEHQVDQETDEEDETGELIIRGYTKEYGDFSSWLQDLKDISLLEDVKYNFLVKTTYSDDIEVYEYEITALVLPGEFDLFLWSRGAENK